MEAMATLRLNDLLDVALTLRPEELSHSGGVLVALPQVRE